MQLVAVTRPVFPEALAPLRSACDIRELGHEVAEHPARRLQLLGGADAVLSTLEDRIDGELLDACPSIRLVANIAVGHDNIDLRACRERGVQVSNTPGVLDDATADHAWALLMAAARRLPEARTHLASGAWRRWELDGLLGVSVHGATLGILGFGRIGQALAARSVGFRMHPELSS